VCDYCGAVLVTRVDCAGCGRKIAASLPRCQYCGAANAAAPAAPTSARPAPKPQISTEAANAIAAATKAAVDRTPPGTAVALHFVFVAVGVALCLMLTTWTPSGSAARLLLLFGGPVTYVAVLAVHYRWYERNERSIMDACEGSDAVHWLVVLSCLLVAVAAVAVVLAHLGIVRPSARRRGQLAQTALVLLAALAAAGYFTWFALRIVQAKRNQ